MRTRWFVLFALSFCATFGMTVMGIVVPDDTAYVMGWYSKGPKGQFEIYSITGVGSVSSDKPIKPTKSAQKGIYAAPPGDRKIEVSVKASANSGMPGLKDGRVELAAHVEAGCLYTVRGVRDGDLVTVWLVDLATDKPASNKVSYDLRREIFILIPIH